MLPNTSEYISLHQWLKYHYGKANHCSNNPNHKSKRFHWANIDGIYEKDIKHFVQLCPSCHKKLDWKEETRKKISLAQAGKPRPYRMIPVIQKSKEGIVIKFWESVTSASKSLGILETSINNCLNGRSKASGGFNWTY